MAERRMFTKKIIDSDAFLDMPLSTQALYFHLNMRADDDGFLNNAKKIQRMIGASEDDLKLLIAKRFVLAFESGVIVIKHWRMHNLIRKDRYNPTHYKEEFAFLGLKDNGAYTEKPVELPMATTWQPDGNQVHPQVRLGKDSIVKDSIYSASDNAPKVSKQDINDFFESIWKLYPSKKGKGQVSDSKKKTLYDIGYDEMARAIERYKTDLAKEDWRKPQNGSTFFNSGYVDYLDANYTPLVVQPQKPKNQFTNFDQRNYDYDALQRMLVDNSVKVSSDPELQAEADALKKMLQETY